MLYAVQAVRVTEHEQGGVRWTGSEQVPTFYLDSEVQGIVDHEHALRIALDVLGTGAPVEVSVVAV